MKGAMALLPTIHKQNLNNSKFMLAALVAVLLHFPLHVTYAQDLNDQVVINADGIMHWRDNGKELTGFGVNYTVPFAHAYRSGKKFGVDLKKAIDQDVSHFERLGLDLFRVHVWDCEISDTLGNLLDNEHLELFDYLLTKLQEANINAIITPIAYWGNGWPDPNEPTPGFSSKYGKDSCLIDPMAIQAQENYLAQFVNHINRYTGISYKNDPSIIAFEISNEPHHRGNPEQVTAFVLKMKNAIRSTGCTKPVFYNVTHAIHFADDYYAASIDGGTFQWYPTGLGFQKELGGNMLPNVDKYDIPFDEVLKKNGSARIVYEFDAADMTSTYMYPAMARSFRTAGMQLATHFSYDPTFLAPYNTEYNTHYMNLLYAPRKALSLMICAEVFRQIPLYSDYGHYPDNTSFGNFKISYEDDLAEMVTDEKFIYTHHTKTKPANLEALTLIAGWGNSPLIEYEGTGAYFLDKLGDGVWRVEIMPDAIQLGNLFGRNSLDKVLAGLQYSRRKMKFNLPGFEHGFAIESVDWRDSILYRETRETFVELKPGVYLLMSPAYERVDSLHLQSKIKFDMDAATEKPESGATVMVPYKSPRHNPSEKSASAGDPIVLFDAVQHDQWLNRKWVPGSGLKKDETTGEPYLSIPLEGLTEVDDENPNAVPIADYSMRHYFGDLIGDRKKDLPRKKAIVLHGSVEGQTGFPVQVSLVMKDGSAFGGIVHLNAEDSKYILKLDKLQRVKPVILPRPYPTFLPYYSDAGNAASLDVTQIESLQISIGPGIAKEDWGNTFLLKLMRVELE
jgi:hypothetical protein